MNSTDQRGSVIQPYAKGFSEKVTKALRSFSIKVAHKPIRTISNILKKSKDKIGKEDNIGIVYKIRCKSCDSVYVGQTSHAKALATLDENSLLAKHHVLHNHEIDLENVEIVDTSPMWRQRLFLEAWHSVRDKNSINEHIALPSVYKNINSFQRH